MQPTATDVWHDRSVCLSVTRMYPAKKAEPIEMPFDMWAQVGPSNHVLDGDSVPPGEGAVLEWGRSRPIVKYREHKASAAERLLDRSRWC